MTQRRVNRDRTINFKTPISDNIYCTTTISNDIYQNTTLIPAKIDIRRSNDIINKRSDFYVDVKEISFNKSLIPDYSCKIIKEKLVELDGDSWELNAEIIAIPIDINAPPVIQKFTVPKAQINYDSNLNYFKHNGDQFGYVYFQNLQYFIQIINKQMFNWTEFEANGSFPYLFQFYNQGEGTEFIGELLSQQTYQTLYFSDDFAPLIQGLPITSTIYKQKAYWKLDWSKCSQNIQVQYADKNNILDPATTIVCTVLKRPKTYDVISDCSPVKRFELRSALLSAQPTIESNSVSNFKDTILSWIPSTNLYQERYEVPPLSRFADLLNDNSVKEMEFRLYWIDEQETAHLVYVPNPHQPVTLLYAFIKKQVWNNHYRSDNYV